MALLQTHYFLLFIFALVAFSFVRTLLATETISSTMADEDTKQRMLLQQFAILPLRNWNHQHYYSDPMTANETLDNNGNKTSTALPTEKRKVLRGMTDELLY